jgi:acyl carrier protein
MTTNDLKLFRLLEDVLLIDENQYKDNFGPDEIETWDSLATVNIAAAVDKEFGYEMEPEEMVGLMSIGDIKAFLHSKGIDFNQ